MINLWIQLSHSWSHSRAGDRKTLRAQNQERETVQFTKWASHNRERQNTNTWIYRQKRIQVKKKKTVQFIKFSWQRPTWDFHLLHFQNVSTHVLSCSCHVMSWDNDKMLMTLGWWLAHMRLLRSRSGCILHHTIDNEAVYTLCLQNCIIYSAAHSIHYKYTELYTAPNILNIINTMYNIQQHHTYFMLNDDNSVANTGSACGWCGTILIQCGTNTNTNTDTNTNPVSHKYKHIHKYSVAHSICKEGWCSCSCISKPPHHDKNFTHILHMHSA